jgi:hypothetical protein
MEEWELYVWGANLFPDFRIRVQIVPSKWSKEIVEHLAYGGLHTILQPVTSLKLFRRKPPGHDPKRAYYHIDILGVERVNSLDGSTERVNDMWLAFELPNGDDTSAGLACLAMIRGQGLAHHLTPRYCKLITIEQKNGLNEFAFEPLSGLVRVS